MRIGVVSKFKNTLTVIKEKIMSSETKGLALYEADRNRDIACQENGIAWSFVRRLNEFEKWEEIKESVYNPGPSDHWRLTYSTYEDAIQAEKTAYELLTNTPEYINFSTANIKYKDAQKASNDARELDEENFSKARS